MVIDLSPYWRPLQFAAAIVIIDALVFHAAPTTLIDTLGHNPDGMQYLLRALIYRTVLHAGVLTLKGASYRLRGRSIGSLPSTRTQNPHTEPGRLSRTNRWPHFRPSTDDG